MKCYYHPHLDAVGQCAQCGKFGCRQCLDDVGGAVLCTSCLSIARQQKVIEDARLVVKVRRAVTASSALAGVLFVFTAITTMMVSVQSDGNILLGLETLFFFTLSSYVTWSGFWGWWPVYRACKTSMAETGCILLATPLTWLMFILVGGMLLFIAAECYGACGVAIARHLKAARIASGQLPPPAFLNGQGASRHRPH